MEKLNLDKQQKVLFEQALSEVYEAAHKNATFMANGVHNLVTPKKDILGTIMGKYS
jgi:hypothetical protein